jgi:Tetratricopeptide repeat
MLEQVASAFENKDYKTAAKLVKQLLKESPEDPWARLYAAKLYEIHEKHPEAEKIYRCLLRDTTNSKIVTQARQGLQRLQEIEKQERQQAISEATADPNNTEPGLLILEPISNELKTEAAQQFAKIMQIDPYSARLLLPSRGWKLYRTGAIGELKFYGTQFLNAGIACFWAKISDVQKIEVLQVDYFQESISGASIVCRNPNGQIGSLNFDWSEVTARVVGLLPIFEQVVNVNNRWQVERKTKTQDYFQFCDLHLAKRRCIIRIHDHGYNFQEGIKIANEPSKNTNRINWNSLSQWLEQKTLRAKTWSDFTPFGETVLDYKELLGQIDSQIHLFRRESTLWDPAFQLYSGLVFVKNLPTYSEF